MISITQSIKGTILGLTNCIGSIPGFVAPAVASAIVVNGVFYLFFGIVRALFFQRWAMIQMSPSGGRSGSLPSLFSSVRSRNSQPFLLSFNCFFRSSSSLCLLRENPRAGITKTKLRDRERIGSWSVPYSFYFLPVKTDILHNSHRSSSRWELHWWELSMLASRWASMATKDLPIQLNGNIPSCLLFPA